MAAWLVAPSFSFQFLRQEVWGEGAGKHHILQSLWWGFLSLPPSSYVAWTFRKKTQRSTLPDLTAITDQSNNSIQVCLEKSMTYRVWANPSNHITKMPQLIRDTDVHP